MILQEVSATLAVVSATALRSISACTLQLIGMLADSSQSLATPSTDMYAIETRSVTLGSLRVVGACNGRAG